MPRPPKAKSATACHRVEVGLDTEYEGFVLANGSMSSKQSGEGDICRALIEADIEADIVDTAMHSSAITQSEATPQILSKAKDNMVALPCRFSTARRSASASGSVGKTIRSIGRMMTVCLVEKRNSIWWHNDMKLAATANPQERQKELGQFLTASPVADFMTSMFGPLPQTVRLLDAGVGALTADSSLRGCARNCQVVCVWRDNPTIKPMK